MASTTSEALKECFQTLGGILTKPEVLSWFEKYYPNKWKPSNITGHLYGCSINNPKAFEHHRSHPRFLFAHGNGRYELYEQAKHGIYEYGLPAGEHGGLTAEANATGTNDDAAATAFAYEEHLRDYLAKNLQILEQNITFWNGTELESVEFPVEGRRIDILAKDRHGLPVVVELKVSHGHEKTIGQCLYYRAIIKELLKVDRVRIFIVAEEISPELKLATKEVPDVVLFEYSLSMTVQRLP